MQQFFSSDEEYKGRKRKDLIQEIDSRFSCWNTSTGYAGAMDDSDLLSAPKEAAKGPRSRGPRLPQGCALSLQAPRVLNFG